MGAARATISLYEHTVSPTRLRRQGCSAAKRGVGGIVILDFGQPAYNGHTYGTYLFSGRFAGNKAITQAMYRVRVRLSPLPAARIPPQITLARGTSNYHPQVPSAYKAGPKVGARDDGAPSGASIARALASTSPPRPPTTSSPRGTGFHRTRDFFRGYRDAHTGHLLYNFGSLDGGVGSVWNARQVFFVTSGMRYAHAIPEIYNHAMARQWAELAHIARHRYHRPMQFAGVMTTHTSRNRGMKPRDAHRSLVRALVEQDRLERARRAGRDDEHPSPRNSLRAQDPDRERGGVPRVVDADRRDRDAGRHLRDREQGVEAVEHAEARPERDADHRQVGVRGDGSRQRRGEPGAADEHRGRARARSSRTRRRSPACGAPSAPRTRSRRPPRRGLDRALHPLAVRLRADEDPDDGRQAWRDVRAELHAGEIYARGGVVCGSTRVGDRVAERR